MRILFAVIMAVGLWQAVTEYRKPDARRAALAWFLFAAGALMAIASYSFEGTQWRVAFAVLGTLIFLGSIITFMRRGGR